MSLKGFMLLGWGLLNRRCSWPLSRAPEPLGFETVGGFKVPGEASLFASSCIKNAVQLKTVCCAFAQLVD